LKNDLYRHYGLLLTDILNKLEITSERTKVKKQIHKALKDYCGVESLTKLNEEELRKYISYVGMIFAREFGISLKRPHDNDSDELKF
jgi:predicted nuclease of restriction endonuclease-like RecB superfamily